eukprot:gnl/Spiro4/5336_TR2708_c0_g1_i1.p1 gnl/Spiro4/5336_TR2708_c0_g1~~gnl/Spiro4/5336_TR2708_c0_g1_i1.p1  ORF type:complete len:995 (+),score=175.16 gnl/Spiro4/5336_TR2708_c0_g1_i1:207-3191(+)
MLNLLKTYGESPVYEEFLLLARRICDSQPPPESSASKRPSALELSAAKLKERLEKEPFKRLVETYGTEFTKRGQDVTKYRDDQEMLLSLIPIAKKELDSRIFEMYRDLLFDARELPPAQGGVFSNRAIHLCLSGGGIRSAFFQLGAISYLSHHDMAGDALLAPKNSGIATRTTNSPLSVREHISVLENVSTISSVSGGSYTACGLLSFHNESRNVTEAAHHLEAKLNLKSNPKYLSKVALFSLIFILAITIGFNAVLVVFVLGGFLDATSGDPQEFNPSCRSYGQFDALELFQVFSIRNPDWRACYTPGNNWFWASVIAGVIGCLALSLLHLLACTPFYVCFYDCCYNRHKKLFRIFKTVVEALVLFCRTALGIFFLSWLMYLCKVFRVHHPLSDDDFAYISASTFSGGLVTIGYQVLSSYGNLPPLLRSFAVRAIATGVTFLLLLFVILFMYTVIFESFCIYVFVYYVVIVVCEPLILEVMGNFYSMCLQKTFFADEKRHCALSEKLKSFQHDPEKPPARTIDYLVNGTVQTAEKSFIVVSTPTHTYCSSRKVERKRKREFRFKREFRLDFANTRDCCFLPCFDFTEKTVLKRAPCNHEYLHRIAGSSGAAVAIAFGDMDAVNASAVRLMLWILNFGLGHWMKLGTLCWGCRHGHLVCFVLRWLIRVADIGIFYVVFVKGCQHAWEQWAGVGLMILFFLSFIYRMIHGKKTKWDTKSVWYQSCIANFVHILRCLVVLIHTIVYSLFFIRHLNLIFNMTDLRAALMAYVTDGGHMENLGLLSTLQRVRMQVVEEAKGKREAKGKTAGATPPDDGKVRLDKRHVIFSYDGGECELGCGCLDKALHLAKERKIIKAFAILASPLAVHAKRDGYISVPTDIEEGKANDLNQRRILKVEVRINVKLPNLNTDAQTYTTYTTTVEVYSGKLMVLGTEENKNLSLYATTGDEFPHHPTANQMLSWRDVQHYKELGTAVAKTAFEMAFLYPKPAPVQQHEN